MQDGYEVFFLDESGFILTDYKIYGWYQKGSQPVKPFVFNNHDRTNLVGAFSTNGFIIAKQYEKINSTNFLEFLKFIKKRYSKFVLIMDNVRMHFVEDLRKWYKRNNIAIIKVPKYSPQLNPIEQYWKNIKQWLGTMPMVTFKKLQTTLEEAIKDTTLWPKSYGY